MLKSWRTKLVLSLLALIVLAMSLSGVLLLSFLDQYFLTATEESLLAQARITAQALIPGAVVAGQQVEQQSPLSNTLQMRGAGNIAVQTQNLQIPEENATLSDIDLGYLSESTFQLGTQLETRIRILDTAGNVLVDSADAQYPGPIENDLLVAQALNGQYAKQTSDIDGVNTMSLAMPVLVESELVGVIYLSHPLRDIETVLHDMRVRWISATAIALALSGAAGLILSSAITRPLRNLTSAAGAVAQGHFDHQVQVRSQDEMGQLSRTFNDMTARLQAARQMQIDFVANVSHELRTPLTAVKGMVETLRAGAVEDTKVRDRFLGTVESETDRMIRLVNDLLILTRADSQALNLDREPVDIAELARKTAARISPQAEFRGVRISIIEGPDVPLAWADRDRVAQVMLNVLDNAIKYSHAGGTVNVTISKENDRDCLDPGAGSGHRHPGRCAAPHWRALLPRGQSPRPG